MNSAGGKPWIRFVRKRTVRPHRRKDSRREAETRQSIRTRTGAGRHPLGKSRHDRFRSHEIENYGHHLLHYLPHSLHHSATRRRSHGQSGFSVSPFRSTSVTSQADSLSQDDLRRLPRLVVPNSAVPLLRLRWYRSAATRHSSPIMSPDLHAVSPFFRCVELVAHGHSTDGLRVIKELLLIRRSTESSRVDTADSCSSLNSLSSRCWEYWYRSVRLIQLSYGID